MQAFVLHGAELAAMTGADEGGADCAGEPVDELPPELVYDRMPTTILTATMATAMPITARPMALPTMCSPRAAPVATLVRGRDGSGGSFHWCRIVTG
jgi:hypothetical protein